LLETWGLHGGIVDSEGAGDFGGTTSIDHAVISDEVADDTQGIM
jgi:hypothetical protein